jgi:Na+-translocating ferredoxin:NAD+ oxidoreductase RNF subunit RnfB
MITPAHQRLANRFDKPPLRTVINDVLLEMLALLFTEEEALLVSEMPGKRSTAKKIAEIVKRPEGEVAPILDSLSSRGLIFSFEGDERRTYFLMPLMPGIFESLMCVAPDSDETRRFAELFHEYYSPEYFKHMLKRPARMFRIIPIEESITSHSGILPADEIRETIDRHDAWSLAHFCACRRQKDLLDRGCNKPKDVCMQFGVAARYVDRVGLGRLVSKQEILDAVDRAEEAGLVHLADNVELANISCNCCACCCVAMQAINSFNVPAILTNSRYIVQLDDEECNGCGDCAEACHVGALHVYQNRLIVKPPRCIGCGACIAKCQTDALELVLRPDNRQVPENYGQMVLDITTETMGIQRYTDAVGPAFSKMLGGLFQKGLKRL